MKAIKAFKKLARIEGLLSNVIERYAASDHSIQAVLRDAKDSVIRAKEAVGLQASPKKTSVKSGRPNRRRQAAIKGTTESPSQATPEGTRPQRRISEEGMKRIIAATKKRWRLQKAEAAKAKPAVAKKTAVKKVIAKKAAKNSTAKKAAKAPEQTASAAQ